MARARNIKPGFFTHEQMAENDPLGRLLFIGLTTIADYKGELEWRPKRIKIQVLPYDECNLDSLAINLDKSGFVRFYSDGDKIFLKIVNFEKHQNPHKNEREAGSEIPSFTEEMRQRVDLKTLAIKSEKIAINPERDGTAPALSLIPHPDSLNPQTESSNCAGTAAALPAKSEPDAKPKKPVEQDTELQSACRETWAAYSTAYFHRYGAEPVRNAKTNSMVRGFVQRIGVDESPHVARFYVERVNDSFVTKGVHDFGLLVARAESYRTQWATNRAVTSTSAQQMDRSSSNYDACQEALRMLEARGA